MKKVKVTLGIALALMLGGVNSVHAQLGGTYGDTTTNKAFSVDVKFYVATDTSYIYQDADKASVEVSHGYTTANNDGTEKAGSYTRQSSSILEIKGANARIKIDENAGDGWLLNPIEAGMRKKWDSIPTNCFTPLYSINACLYNKDSQNSDCGKLSRYLIRDTIRMEKMEPLIKRVITIQTDTMYWVLPGHPNNGTLLKVEEYITSTGAKTVKSGDKTLYTEYYYEDDVTALALKYSIVAIEYYLTVGKIDDGPGSGAQVTINRTYKIEAAEGITTDPIAGLTHGVQSHSPFDITVTGTAGKEIEVKASKLLNYEEPIYNKVLDEDGKTVIHFLSGITANTIINISYVPEEEGGSGEGTQGNSVIAADAVWSAGGTLYVKAASAGTLSVYSVTGQLLKKTAVTGSYTLALPKGLYIVQLNGKAYKVIL